MEAGKSSFKKVTEDKETVLNTPFKTILSKPVTQKVKPPVPLRMVHVVEGAKKFYNATDMPLSAVGSNYSAAPGESVDVSQVPLHLLNFWKQIKAVKER